MNLYAHSVKNPFHISAGGVLVDADDKIFVHKMTAQNIPLQHRHKLAGLDTVFILMRETPEAGEALEHTALRGFKEEFGAEAELTRYLGSIQGFVPEDGGFEKTTVYFEAKLVSLSVRPTDDAEGYSELERHDPQFLIERMREQGRQHVRGDMDESKIIEAYLRLKNL